MCIQTLILVCVLYTCTQYLLRVVRPPLYDATIHDTLRTFSVIIALPCTFILCAREVVGGRAEGNNIIENTLRERLL